MKKITAVFAFVALLLGTAGAFATSAPFNSRSMLIEKWYFYNGGGESNPANYTLASGTPSCQLGSILCAVKTSTDGSGQPIPTRANTDQRYAPALWLPDSPTPNLFDRPVGKRAIAPPSARRSTR